MSCAVGIAAAVAHGRVVDHHAAIDAGTGERKPERARHRGLRPAGVRRAMLPRVAPDRAPRRCAADAPLARTISSADKPRRRQVDEIVEPGGGEAEVLVARRVVADHAVGGVDRLVGRAAGKPADREPEHRRDDAVGEILGEAFDRGARHAGLVERIGIAADDLRHRAAAGVEAIAFQRVGDAGDVLIEASLRDQAAGEDGDDDEAERQQQQPALDRIGQRGRDRRRSRTARQSPRPCAWLRCRRRG